MTRLGFVLASDSCIGCHACTVACKSEHDVPLGVNRTWLKYVETGSFPNTGRSFTVMRCNHCDDAPCMTICPTSALHRASNGVVDFDDSRCIGCKACMNACPYDALYINPETNTAHKCNFCNHRVEVGLEPACVVVCPTHAIITGDLDDPNSEISKIVARDKVSVRAPEQGTNPKVFYRGVDQAALDPTRTRIADDGMIWADTTKDHPTITNVMAEHSGSGVIGRTAYTTTHPMTWKSKVSGYLVTKAVAAGVMAMAALMVILGHGDSASAAGVFPAVVAGVFTAITGVLLVADLKQPSRFLFILTKSNTSSWLVRGAWILGAFAAVTGLWGLLDLTGSNSALPWLALPQVVLAAGVAGYTAFLFGQCEGRDLWQTPLLLPTLLAQAVVAGGASYGILDLIIEVPEPGAVRIASLGGLGALALLIGTELVSHGSRSVELATLEMTRGAYARHFWLGGVVLGLVIPIALLASPAGGSSAGVAIAGVSALIGLFAYEDAYVRAGQSVPLS
ncbi:MAG: polysulfide reductase NrfD [Actinomycetota bacterium]|jgi:Fe-S-cluster-containing dehydrogenase component/formate-dependent nitrite reductase membrane component NrfD|nr:polysulfide reductase NrfD [Actinomycetota bacterium]